MIGQASISAHLLLKVQASVAISICLGTVCGGMQANGGGAPAARGGMLQRARAKKEGTAGAGEPVFPEAPVAPESTDPAAPARNGMLERARAKKQGT